jgi:hypothetical protein
LTLEIRRPARTGTDTTKSTLTSQKRLLHRPERHDGVRACCRSPDRPDLRISSLQRRTRRRGPGPRRAARCIQQVDIVTEQASSSLLREFAARRADSTSRAAVRVPGTRSNLRKILRKIGQAAGSSLQGEVRSTTTRHDRPVGSRTSSSSSRRSDPGGWKQSRAFEYDWGRGLLDRQGATCCVAALR